MRRRLTGALLALPLAVALAACGGPQATGNGIASAGGNAAAPAAGSSTGPVLSDGDRQLEFARCMREQGVDMPDPGTGGKGPGIRITGGPKDGQKAKAAMEKCREFLPNGGQGRKLNPEQAEKMREFAKCMRANGVEDFPDPDANGAVRIQKGGPGGDPDLDKAMEACRELRPGKPGAAR